MNRLWSRQLDHYPDTRPRLFYLAIVVISAVVLYYELFVQASVTPSIIAHYHMTFPFFVYLVVVGNVVGAFASLAAGLADRWGRSNLVAYGLLVTGLLTLFGLPNAPNLWVYAVLFSVLGVVEGIVLVATPALVRDFSPQLGRASAMGFWTMGPVLGSLIVAEVSSHTLVSHPAGPDWRYQFYVCGVVGLVVFVLALFGLRELSPGLRDQLMVSHRDRELIEARAAGIDIEESLHHPWRQMLHVDIIGSALAISLFLFLYYTLVSFLVVYFSTVFGFSSQQANSLGNWMWAFDAVGLVVTGFVSDLLRVRKPFMVVGGVGAIVMTVLFALRTGHPHTSYYTFVAILAPLAVLLGVAFAPWMASFTETVERRNPALTATGLAIWGWILRIVVSLLLFSLPYVVTSATPLVEYGQQAQAIAARYPTQVVTLAEIDPATVATLGSHPSDAAAITRAETEIAAQAHVPPAVALGRLLAVSKVPRPDLDYLQAHGMAVQKALAAAPGEWRRWWWVAVGGQVVFLPLIFLMAGRWSPAAARRDEEEHQRRVAAELAALPQSVR
jgi:MFS family permease